MPAPRKLDLGQLLDMLAAEGARKAVPLPIGPRAEAAKKLIEKAPGFAPVRRDVPLSMRGEVIREILENEDLGWPWPVGGRFGRKGGQLEYRGPRVPEYHLGNPAFQEFTRGIHPDLLDTQGNPKALIHATEAHILNMKEGMGKLGPENLGLWLAEADNPALTNAVSDWHVQRNLFGKAGFGHGRGAAQQIPVVAALRRPLVIPKRHGMEEQLVKLLSREMQKRPELADIISPSDLSKFKDPLYREPEKFVTGEELKRVIEESKIIGSRVKDALEALGYDSLKFADDLGYGPAWVAFHPAQQVKSIFNTGTFKPGKDIMHGLAPVGLGLAAQGSEGEEKDPWQGELAAGPRFGGFPRLGRALAEEVEAGPMELAAHAASKSLEAKKPELPPTSADDPFSVAVEQRLRGFGPRLPTEGEALVARVAPQPVFDAPKVEDLIVRGLYGQGEPPEGIREHITPSGLLGNAYRALNLPFEVMDAPFEPLTQRAVEAAGGPESLAGEAVNILARPSTAVMAGGHRLAGRALGKALAPKGLPGKRMVLPGEGVVRPPPETEALVDRILDRLRPKLQPLLEDERGFIAPPGGGPRKPLVADSPMFEGPPGHFHHRAKMVPGETVRLQGHEANKFEIQPPGVKRLVNEGPNWIGAKVVEGNPEIGFKKYAPGDVVGLHANPNWHTATPVVPPYVPPPFDPNLPQVMDTESLAQRVLDRYKAKYDPELFRVPIRPVVKPPSTYTPRGPEAPPEPPPRKPPTSAERELQGEPGLPYLHREPSTMDALAKRLIERGGFTFNPRTGEMERSGVAVATHPSRESVYGPGMGGLGEAEPEAVSEMLAETLRGEPFYRRPGMDLGGWKSPGGGVHVEPVEIAPDVRTARKLGVAAGQRSVFALPSGPEVPVRQPSMSNQGALPLGSDLMATAKPESRPWPTETMVPEGIPPKGEQVNLFTPSEQGRPSPQHGGRQMAMESLEGKYQAVSPDIVGSWRQKMPPEYPGRFDVYGREVSPGEPRLAGYPHDVKQEAIDSYLQKWVQARPENRREATRFGAVHEPTGSDIEVKQWRGGKLVTPEPSPHTLDVGNYVRGKFGNVYQIERNDPGSADVSAVMVRLENPGKAVHTPGGNRAVVGDRVRLHKGGRWTLTDEPTSSGTSGTVSSVETNTTNPKGLKRYTNPDDFPRLKQEIEQFPVVEPGSPPPGFEPLPVPTSEAEYAKVVEPGIRDMIHEYNLAGTGMKNLVTGEVRFFGPGMHHSFFNPITGDRFAFEGVRGAPPPWRMGFVTRDGRFFDRHEVETYLGDLAGGRAIGAGQFAEDTTFHGDRDINRILMKKLEEAELLKGPQKAGGGLVYGHGGDVIIPPIGYGLLRALMREEQPE